MLLRPRPLLEGASESLAERHTALRVEAGTGMLKHQTAQRNTNRTAQARLRGGGVGTLVGAACAHVHVSFVAGEHTVRRCSAHDGSMVLFKVTETHLATGTRILIRKKHENVTRSSRRHHHESTLILPQYSSSHRELPTSSAAQSHAAACCSMANFSTSPMLGEFNKNGPRRPGGLGAKASVQASKSALDSGESDL